MSRGAFGQGFVTMGCCGAVLGHPHEFGCDDGRDEDDRYTGPPCPGCGDEDGPCRGCLDNPA